MPFGTVRRHCAERKEYTCPIRQFRLFQIVKIIITPLLDVINVLHDLCVSPTTLFSIFGSCSFLELPFLLRFNFFYLYQLFLISLPRLTSCLALVSWCNASKGISPDCRWLHFSTQDTPTVRQNRQHTQHMTRHPPSFRVSLTNSHASRFSTYSRMRAVFILHTQPNGTKDFSHTFPNNLHHLETTIPVFTLPSGLPPKWHRCPLRL